jgi:hypothetical protein
MTILKIQVSISSYLKEIFKLAYLLHGIALFGVKMAILYIMLNSLIIILYFHQIMILERFGLK